MKPEVARTLGSLLKAAAKLVDRKTTFVLVVHWYEYESDRSGEKRRELSRADILEEVRQGFRTYNTLLHTDKVTGQPRLPLTLQELYYYVAINHGSDEGNGVDICTKREYKKRQQEQEYQKAEEAAAFIANQYNVKAGSLAFVRAAKKHYSRIVRSERRFRDDPEVRAERYGCALANGSTAGFWDDNDYAGERIAEAVNGHRLVLKWLHRNCPLLMAKLAERKLRRV